MADSKAFKKYNKFIAKYQEKGLKVNIINDKSCTINKESLDLKVEYNDDESITLSSSLFDTINITYPFQMIDKLLSRSWEEASYTRRLGQTKFESNAFAAGWEEWFEDTAGIYWDDFRRLPGDVNELIIYDDDGNEITINNEPDCDYYCSRATMETEVTFPYAPSKQQLEALNDHWTETIFDQWSGYCADDGGEVVCGEYFYKN